MFIHLHNHSHYSLLDGLPKIGDYVKKALEYKMPALGLTDHGTMYGIIEFYQKCRDAGIKPILGFEAYLAPRRLELKHPDKDIKPYHLILLAKNMEGYKNLMYLTTIAHLDGFYYKPRIDKEVLKEHAQGLIATSACMAGEISRLLAADKWDAAEQAVKEYQTIFGRENFYLELEYIGNLADQTEMNTKLIKLAKQTRAPLVASRDTHYINADDKVAQDALVCVQTGKILTDKNRLDMTFADLDFIHPRLMEEYFKDIAPEATKNTEKIAAECNVNLDLGQWHFPKFELPADIKPEDKLKDIAATGLQTKFPNYSPEIKERLDYEIEVINKKGYAPYFLIVSDLIKWARQREIVTTTRGSAAGSLVGYVTEITTLDPLVYGLPFERFLNPYRPSPPDIDMDFADNRREEVLNYVRQKYGYDKVANISTFGTMMARGSVRDVTRVLGLPYELGDKLSKLIPFGMQGNQMTIDKALTQVTELKNFYETDPQTKQILDLARKIEGCARHVSVHAAGVVIAPTTLTDFSPLQKDPTEQRGIITQYEMHACEATGLIKFDFLGIRNLSILGDAAKIVERTKNIKIDISQLPLDDRQTFEFISQGYTFGMFQLGGEGMTKWLVELQPNNIKEIMAMVALFRPGPMDSIPEYIARKQGLKPIEYLDPKLKTILKDTYGVITYQEDVMLIAIEIAGYTWETVDKFRKAIGKKIPELMAQQEKIFIEGCQQHSGWPKNKAEALWKLFDPFKGYGFNKAHAASYGLVAYQTAYLKAHYPAEFMTAVMTAESQNMDKIVEAVNECTRLGIKVLPPDVNYSRPDFTYSSDKEIRFGLLAIKNLGHDIANVIIAERKNNGLFTSLENFLTRVETRNLNKKSLEALIKVGAMDSLGDRNQMLENMDKLLAFVRAKQKERNTNQLSLFGGLGQADTQHELKLSAAASAELKVKLAWEKELLGLYLSGHPFAEMHALVEPHITYRCIEVIKNNTNQQVKLAGCILKVHKVFTKKNEPMYFVVIADTTGEVEAVVFPRLAQAQPDLWQEDTLVLIVGKISNKDEKPKIIVDLAYSISQHNLSEVGQQIAVDLPKIKQRFNINNSYNSNKVTPPAVSDSNTRVNRLWIKLPKFFNTEIHQQLKDVFDQVPGTVPVCLTLEQTGILRKIQTAFKVSYTIQLKQKLEKITGDDSIKIEYK